MKRLLAMTYSDLCTLDSAPIDGLIQEYGFTKMYDLCIELDAEPLAQYVLALYLVTYVL